MAPRKKMKPAETAQTLSKKVEKAAEDEKSRESEELSDETEQEDTEPLQAVVTGVKRARGRPAREENLVKRKKLEFRQQRGWGQVLTVGQGDTGQLGLGEDVMEKSRPAAVGQMTAAVDAVAGGMHTVVLDKEGQVWTFGCNDEGSLGRLVEEEEDCFLPGRVNLDEKVVMLSAGDSHTAALSESGQVSRHLPLTSQLY